MNPVRSASKTALPNTRVMDSIPTETVASSALFRFLVGPNQREFTIHSALFSQQSPVFEKMVNGSFSEAAEKCVTWKSVDEDTFIRFWQYTYTGKYTADRPIIGFRPEPETNRGDEPKAAAFPVSRRAQELKRAAIAREEQELADLLRRRSTRFFNPDKDKSRIDYLQKSVAAGKAETQSRKLTNREAQWYKFKYRRAYACSEGSRSTGLSAGEPGKGNQAHGDYTNTFLSHARLYIFAECYGVAGLMELSMNELHRTLVTFTLYQERVNDVVELARHCYENPVPEALKEIVTQYLACKIEMLWPSKQFQAFVEAHGELSKSLIGLMLRAM